MTENAYGRAGDSDLASVGVLDLLAVAAEAWPLLVVGPLAAGAIAYAATAAQPTQFVAAARVVLSSPTGKVIDEAAIRAIVDEEIGADPQRTFAVQAETYIVTVRAVAPDSDAAIEDVRAATTALYNQPALSHGEIEALTSELAYDLERQRDFEGLLADLKLAATASNGDGAVVGEAASIADIIALSDKVASLRVSNDTRRRTIGSTLTTSPEPAVYVEQVSRRWMLPVVTAVVFTALGIYLLAFFRDRWKAASRSPSAAPKVERIRRSFWMRQR